jgi:2,5-diketo-D-gluconate reductase A
VYQFNLNDGNSIPAVGVGTYLLSNGALMKNEMFPFPVLLDTAEKYGNVEIINSIISDLKYNKQDFQIITKVNYQHQIQKKIREVIFNELQQYKLDAFDVILIHSPRYERFWDTWEELELLKSQHYVKSIGVSNFGINELNTLESMTGAHPAINQILVNPSAYPKELIEYCHTKMICVQAYCPLANGTLSPDKFPVLKTIANKRNRTIPQIVLRWLYQQKIASIPKSSTVQHLRENMLIFDFELDKNEVTKINTLY